jgi:serine/threonine protein kinase/tetratricopeptide (TPR) repeat protein
MNELSRTDPQPDDSIDSRIDSTCDRYEAAWKAGETPLVNDFLGEWEEPHRSALRRELMRLKRHCQAKFAPTVNASVPGKVTDSAENESLRQSPFLQINEFCEAFRLAWNDGDIPSLSQHVGQVDERDQSALLRNLLDIEVKERRNRRQQPTADDYIRQFPDHASVIRQVFLEASSVKRSMVETNINQTVIMQAPAAWRLGDYQLVRELGRGGMGIVFEAVHVHRRNRVALKTLPTLDAEELHRFKREFRSVADVNHPSLIGLHTLEADGNQWFITMDLLVGESFLEYVRPARELDEQRLRSALTQLVTGVLALHANHIIHRDLKSQNVMVGPDGHLVLLDFGLVMELDRRSLGPTAEMIVGTPAYMSPEQAAGLPVTSASDWYAAGVMLYEALTGEHPFSGPMLKVLTDKQHLEPPTIVGRESVPDDLGELCMHLLARDPAARPDPLQITKVIAAQSNVTSIASGRSADELIGREHQLAALNQTLAGVESHGEPRVSFVIGRSGEGKTSLCEHFLKQLQKDRRFVVMSGRCYERESVPYKALDTVVDALAGYLQSLPRDEAALMMPRDVSILTQLFPVLERVEVVARAPRVRLTGLDEQQVRSRAFGAMRELLWRISDRAIPVWLIDDLQWGDSNSAAALFDVLKPPEAPAMLLIGTYRSDEIEESAFLETWHESWNASEVELCQQQIPVGPFSVEQCIDCVVSLVGQDSETIRHRAIQFHVETGGNPFLLTELAGCFDPTSNTFQSMPIRELIEQKLDRLPDDARQLLQMIAIAGQSISVDDASRAVGKSVQPVETLIKMRTERLIRRMGSDGEQALDTYHDRIRETVRDDMDETVRKHGHLALAKVIEHSNGGISDTQLAALRGGDLKGATAERAIPRVYDLVYHFDKAGAADRALPYALLAAQQARLQYAQDVVANQLAIAERNAAHATAPMRLRIAEGRGEALMLLGNYDEAQLALRNAAVLARTDSQHAKVDVLQGELALKRSEVLQSIQHCEQGLRRMGIRVPRTRIGFAVAAMGQLVVQISHCLFPKRLHQEPQREESSLILDLLEHLTHSYFFTDLMKTAWCVSIGSNRAERIPKSLHLAFLYSQNGLMAMTLGLHSSAERYFRKASLLGDEFGDIRQFGRFQLFRGLASYSAGSLDEALESLDKSTECFKKIGDKWHYHLATFHLGLVHQAMGNLPKATELAKETFVSSVRIGDTRSHCSSYLWAKSVGGDLDLCELKACYTPVPEEIPPIVNSLKADAIWHLHHCRYEQAIEVLQRAWSLTRKSMVFMPHTIAVLPLMANAMRLEAESLRGKDTKPDLRKRKRALKTAKCATWLTRLAPIERPYALREYALMLKFTGRTNGALRVVEKSCKIALDQGAKYEYAKSLLVQGQLARELGIANADEQIRTAQAELKRMAVSAHTI